MPNKYIDSVDSIKAKYPNFIPLDSGNKWIHRGHEYNQIGTDTKSHGAGWQFGRTTMALGTTALSLLLIPLAFKKYRNLTERLWKEGYSGSEKISLYFKEGDMPSLQNHLERTKALRSVRKNGDNYSQLDSKHRDDEELFLEALKTASINLLPHASERLQASRTVALALVRKDGKNFEPLSKDFRDDEEIFLKARECTTTNLFPYASYRLNNSKSLAITLVTKFGPDYEHLSDSMKKEKDVAYAAFKYYDKVCDTLNKNGYDTYEYDPYGFGLKKPDLKDWASKNLSKLRHLHTIIPTELKNDKEIIASYKKNKKAMKACLKQPVYSQTHVTTINPVPTYHQYIYQPAPVFIPTPTPVFTPLFTPSFHPVHRQPPIHHHAPPVHRPMHHHVPSRPMHHHVPAHRPFGASHHVPVGTRRF